MFDPTHTAIEHAFFAAVRKAIDLYSSDGSAELASKLAAI